MQDCRCEQEAADCPAHPTCAECGADISGHSAIAERDVWREEVQRLRKRLTPLDGSEAVIIMGSKTYEEMLEERDQPRKAAISQKEKPLSTKEKLQVAFDMEGDATIGAGAGFGKYTREVAERMRSRRVPDADQRPGSAWSIDCEEKGCPETLTLERTTTVKPSHEDDYLRLGPACGEAAVLLGWRTTKHGWMCPTHASVVDVDGGEP